MFCLTNLCHFAKKLDRQVEKGQLKHGEMLPKNSEMDTQHPTFPDLVGFSKIIDVSVYGTPFAQ